MPERINLAQRISDPKRAITYGKKFCFVLCGIEYYTFADVAAEVLDRYARRFGDVVHDLQLLALHKRIAEHLAPHAADVVANALNRRATTGTPYKFVVYPMEKARMQLIQYIEAAKPELKEQKMDLKQTKNLGFGFGRKKGKKSGQTATTPPAHPAPFDALPDGAYLRAAQLVRSDDNQTAPLPFSSATLWRKVREGQFPEPVRLSERVTAWRVADVRAWMAEAQASPVQPGRSCIKRTTLTKF